MYKVQKDKVQSTKVESGEKFFAVIFAMVRTCSKMEPLYY